MRRREVLFLAASSVVAPPLSSLAQWASRRLVVGLLGSGSPASYAPFVEAFRRGLSELGYIEGKNLEIEFRWAGGRFERLPSLAADLVDRKVDVIATIGGTPSARAAKEATSTIPIAFSSVADPLGAGLVASLERPEGNLTGISDTSSQLTPTRLDLVCELVPNAAVIGLLANPKNASSASMVAAVQERTNTRDLRLEILNATSDSEIDSAFTSAAQRGIGALVIASDPFFTSRREQLVALAAHQRLPAIYSLREFVVSGGLMSYGPNIENTYRELGLYVGKILKGARPADLPVQQVTRFDLVINLKTAGALALTVPQSLLDRAELLD